MSDITINGRQADLLLWALDEYLHTDQRGKIKPTQGAGDPRLHGHKLWDVQKLRDILMANHDH